MAYQVLSLKWRPKTFSDVVGQDHVSDTLVNAFKKDRIAQGYLFTGPRGVGKTTTARLLGMVLNCQNSTDGNPCNTCSNCLEIAESRNMDVLEIDGASNRGIEEIRNLREMIKYAPINSKYKIFIIDEVHMLTGPAFNALLKTLEEPPPHGKFILATTDIHKVPPTIISRCQRYDFNRISVKVIADRLKYVLEQEKIKFDDDSIQVVARKADGSMRDGLSHLDQLIAYCGDEITYESAIKVLGLIPFDLYFRLTTSIKSKDAPGAIELLSDIQSSGVPVIDFVDGLSQHIRNLLFASVPQSAPVLELSEELIQRYLEESPQWDNRDLLRMANSVMLMNQTLRKASHPYLQLEMLVMKLLEMDAAVSIDEVLKKIPEQPAKAYTAPQPKAAPVKPKAAPRSQPVQEPPSMPEPPVMDAPPPMDEAPAAKPARQPEPPAEKPKAAAPAAPKKTTREPKSGGLTMEELMQKWGAIYSEIMVKYASVGNQLEQSQFSDIKNNRLIISVVAGSNFAFRRIESKTLELEKVFNKHLDNDIKLQFVKADAGAAPAAPKPEMNVPAPAPQNDEGEDNPEKVVDKIVELFDGETIR